MKSIIGKSLAAPKTESVGYVGWNSSAKVVHSFQRTK